MLVTVGVPTYNRAASLRLALSDIARQSHRDLEVIVCDDGSEDDTANAVAPFLSDDRFHYVPLAQNRGIPGVLNEILERARGEAIVMLHDHDRFGHRLVEDMVRTLVDSETAGFVNPGVGWSDEGSSVIEEMSSPFAPGIVHRGALLEQMLQSTGFACPVTASALVSRSAYESVGFEYDPQFGFLADVDLWLRLALRFDFVQLPGTDLVCTRRRGDHPANAQAWKLTRLAIAIQEVNVLRYFDGDPLRIEECLRLVHFKSNRAYRRLLLQGVVQGDAGMVAEAGQHWSPSGPTLASRGLAALASSPVALRLLASGRASKGAVASVRGRSLGRPTA